MSGNRRGSFTPDYLVCKSMSAIGIAPFYTNNTRFLDDVKFLGKCEQDNIPVWNQLVKPFNSTERTANGCTFSVTNGVFSIVSVSGVTTAIIFTNYITENSLGFRQITGHKYYSPNTLPSGFYFAANVFTGGITPCTGTIGTGMTSSSVQQWSLKAPVGTTVPTAVQCPIMIFDLTLLYGAGNEPTTVEQFNEDYEELFGHSLTSEPWTPGTPLERKDIVCNNGTLELRHQSGLPNGYQLLEYIQSSGTQWIDTGIKGHMNYTYEIEFQQTDTGNYRNWGTFGQSSYVGLNMSLTYGGSGFIVRWESQSSKQQYVDLGSIDTNKHTLKIVNGEIYYDGIDKGKSVGHSNSLVIDYNLFLGTINPGGTTPSANSKTKFYLYKVYDENSALIQNLIPSKRKSDNVIGMYDIVSGQFFTNSGTGSFTAGQTVEDLDMYVDVDTQETLSIHGNNLWDEKWESGRFDTTSGDNVDVNTQIRCKNLIQINPQNTYYLRIGDRTSTDGAWIMCYNANMNIVPNGVANGNSTSGNCSRVSMNQSITFSNTVKYFKFYIVTSYGPTYLNDITISLFSVESYEPYFNGGTATATNLLGCGKYQDIQSITTGEVSRNVGIKVLTGTESFALDDWRPYSGTYAFALYKNELPNILETSSNNVMCTHFQSNGYTDASGVYYIDQGLYNGGTGICIYSNNGDYSVFIRVPSTIASSMATMKTWLAQQYANGTPVTIVYPLNSSEPDTQVAAQQLTAQKGTNTYEIIQASIDDLRLQVDYKAIDDSTDYLSFTATADNSSVKLNKVGSPPAVNLEYSPNTSAWIPYRFGDTISLSNGDKVYFRNADSTVKTQLNTGNSSNYHRFVMTGSIEAGGNIMSLLDKSCNSTTVGTGCFYSLFRGCTALKEPPRLPATTIGSSAYYDMFYGCTYLLHAPELPATTLNSYCYYDMFINCTRMVSAPVLRATIVLSGSYYCMFQNCNAVTSHHVANLNSSCQKMFNNNSACIQLTIDAVTPPTINSDTFSGLKSDCIIYVPAESVDAYKAKQYWSDRASYIQAIPSN